MKCRAQRCTEGNRQYLFPGHVDTNSLVVQDEYVFTQVCIVMDYFSELNSTSCLHFVMRKLLSLNFDFLVFFFFFVFIFDLLCIQFMLFHQNPHNGFPPGAPVPHWPNVCFDYVLSRSCQGTLSVWVSVQTCTWEHMVKELWIDRLVSLLPFTLTLTSIRQRQSGSPLEI